MQTLEKWSQNLRKGEKLTFSTSPLWNSGTLHRILNRDKKAAWPGDIPSELFKYGPTVLIEEIVEIINICIIYSTKFSKTGILDTSDLSIKKRVKFNARITNVNVIIYEYMRH